MITEQQFIDFVQTWWPVIGMFWLYSTLRHGPKNRAKYRRWDKMRERQRKAKWQRK